MNWCCFQIILILGVGLELGLSQTKRVVCYWNNWSVYRNGNGKSDPTTIDPSLCTHVIYNVAAVSSDYKAISADPWSDSTANGGLGNYRKTIALKRKNQSLKVLLTVGGWSSGSLVFSKLASNSSARRTFVESALSLVQENKFDGANINWQFPASRGGNADDKKYYPLLLQEMKEAFTQKGLLLSLDISGAPAIIKDGYDIPAIARNVDFINVNAYDYHGSWEDRTGMPSALYGKPGEHDNQNVNYTISYLLELGAPREKLVLVVPSLARSWTLQDPDNFIVGAPAPKPGKTGPYVHEAGALGYNELCEMFNEGSWMRFFDGHYQSSYAILNDQWVGYEDEPSVAKKGVYAKSKDLGGVGLSTLDTDDFNGVCGPVFPLLNSLRNSFM